MKFDYINESFSPALLFTLDAGEEIRIENGSMIFHDPSIVLQGKKNGNSVLGAFAKKMLTGESFFLTTALSNANQQRIAIAPSGIGSIKHLELNGQSGWIVSDGSYLASTSGIQVNVESQKNIGSSIFGGTGGFFILKAVGTGDLFVESFGALIEIELDGSQDFIIDNGHLVAWEDTLSYNIQVASGTFGFTTGEGLVNRLSGRGKIIVQTRQLASFASTLLPFMPAKA